MTDTDPIGICIEARARDLHAALADAVDGAPQWRRLARELLQEIEEAAQRNMEAVHGNNH
jgi:hypothetical protein